MKTAGFLILFSVIFFSCDSDSSLTFDEFDTGKVLSVINEDTLTSFFFEKAYIENLIKTGKNDTREHRYQFLNKLIDDFLLSQQAEDYELLDSAYTDYMLQVKRISIADRFFTSSFLDTLSLPTEQQVQTAFFNTKIKMYVSHLYFTDKEEAYIYYDRLQKDESFLDLANELYNLAEYDSSAGYLGEISYFNVDAAFGEAAYQLKTGEYSAPVRTREGYHIIYVNHRIGNPLITEAEFKYKKEGITGLTKNRIKTVLGDVFVRNYMESLNVKVNESAVELLMIALKNLHPQKNNNPINLERQIKNYPSSEDVNLIRDELAPGTILASYNHLGKTRYFKAEDYFKWFKTIPLQEAQTNTAASVGRALRNQVFFEAGLEKGLESDPIIQFNLSYKNLFYKSYRVKEYLNEQPLPDFSEEEKKAAFYGFGLNETGEQYFSGWKIEADNLVHAKQAKQDIEQRKREPEMFDSYQQFEGKNAKEMIDLRSYIFKVPLNSPMVIATNKGFYVLNISQRTENRVKLQDAESEVVDRMSKYYNVVKKLKELRQTSVIKTDTSAFEALMVHFNDPALKDRR